MPSSLSARLRPRCPGPNLAAGDEAADAVVRRVVRQIRVDAGEDQRDAGIEGIGACARCSGGLRARRRRARGGHDGRGDRRDGRRSGRFGRLQALLQRLKARLVGGAHRVDFMAQRVDIGLGIGQRAEWRGQGEREARRQKLGHGFSLRARTLDCTRPAVRIRRHGQRSVRSERWSATQVGPRRQREPDAA